MGGAPAVTGALRAWPSARSPGADGRPPGAGGGPAGLGASWGDVIVGFGHQPYTTADGKERDWFAVGLSPRKAALTLYGLTYYGTNDDLLDRLGKHTTGKGCLHLKRSAMQARPATPRLSPIGRPRLRMAPTMLRTASAPGRTALPEGACGAVGEWQRGRMLEIGVGGLPLADRPGRGSEARRRVTGPAQVRGTTMRAIGWSLLVVGVAIAGLWTLLLVTGQVPEVDEGRVDIWFHLAAELATAGVLIAAGTALLRRSRHGRSLATVAVGALAYTTLNSPGYYAESGEWAVVGMFMVLLVLTITMAVALVRGGRPGKTADVTPAAPRHSTDRAVPR
jgi:hypothetical protein